MYINFLLKVCVLIVLLSFYFFYVINLSIRVTVIPADRPMSKVARRTDVFSSKEEVMNTTTKSVIGFWYR